MFSFLGAIPLIGTVIAFISGFGSIAAFIGPIGIAIAALGAFFSRTAVKLVMIGIGLLVLVVSTVAVSVHIDNLEHDREAYRVQSAMVHGLEAEHGCSRLQAHLQSLPACLAEEQRAIEFARNKKLNDFAHAAATAQLKLSEAEDDNRKLSQAIDDLLVSGANDGPLPKIITDSWAIERAQRGLK